MTSNPTIRLLILNDSRAEAERLISMLHNAGRPTRAQHVESEEALIKLLQEQSWDLILGLDVTQNVPPATAVKQIRRLAKDVPMILLTDEEGAHAIVEGLKLGAADVVRLDEDQHLLQVINRELSNRESRAQQRLAERRYKEIERRNQQLLDSSRDAITFVQDGMFLYANQSFAELLGYKDRSDLECMPVIDMVDDRDQERVKDFLKEFMLRGSDVETTKLTFQSVTQQQNKKPLNVEVRKSQYDEEMCIQFVVRANTTDNAELEAQLQQIRHQDLVTGLHNKNYLIERLEEAVDAAVTNHTTSALLYIGITDFLESVQQKLGLASADIALGTIANFAKTLVKPGETFCRFNEAGFMLLIPKIDVDSAQKRGEDIGRTLRSHIVDIDGATLQFVYHVGIGIINETTSNSDTPISHALKALELTIARSHKDKNAIATTFEEEAPATASGRSPKEIAKMVQNALNRGKFRLLFQPILSLRGSDKEHYEVLLRMVDEDNSGMSPTEFLGVAAEIGATTKIDRWVILEAIKVLAQHRAAGNNTRLILNLSKESLKDTTLPPWLGVAFKAAKLPPEAIIFQLQENDINDHLNIAKSFTNQVTALGCGCSISHFGCALNPFSALEHVSAQYIKVDGSFTKELQSGGGEPEALSTLVNQIHEHEKITIVPFVENASVLSKLWQSGVHYIQGYYLQGPAETMDYDFDTET
jgi:diguanylate cyclase (GGDEF)-like protein/PAS domain S-box-containing protein